MGWADSYTGRSSYKYAEKLIREGKEILIVSPYLDRHYAEFIVRNGKGKQIRIISSSIEKKVRKILDRKRSFGNFIAVLMLVLPFDYLTFTLSALTLSIILASLIILSVSFIFFIHRKNDIEVKIPKEFIHAKFYVSDNIAMLGSANLTYKGMHENVEHIEIKDDERSVSRLRTEFWKLWNAR